MVHLWLSSFLLVLCSRPTTIASRRRSLCHGHRLCVPRAMSFRTATRACAVAVVRGIFACAEGMHCLSQDRALLVQAFHELSCLQTPDDDVHSRRHGDSRHPRKALEPPDQGGAIRARAPWQADSGMVCIGQMGTVA